jgi:cytosine/adenosine deaminase-related metal-dependent hydrolase
MKLTADAKATYSQDADGLYTRGKRLIQESLLCGVTSMRAHVEIDDTVGFLCLEVASRLKHEFSALCQIQIAGM